MHDHDNKIRSIQAPIDGSTACQYGGGIARRQGREWFEMRACLAGCWAAGLLLGSILSSTRQFVGVTHWREDNEATASAPLGPESASAQNGSLCFGFGIVEMN